MHPSVEARRAANSTARSSSPALTILSLLTRMGRRAVYGSPQRLCDPPKQYRYGVYLAVTLDDRGNLPHAPGLQSNRSVWSRCNRERTGSGSN